MCQLFLYVIQEKFNKNNIMIDPKYNFINKIFTLIILFGLAACTTQNETQVQDTEPQIFTQEMQQQITPEEALDRLKAGNKRFVNDSIKYKDYREQFEGTAEGQYPHSTVFACIDSRSSAEHFFDLGIGEIFKARIAGNALSEDVIGSMEFATKAAGSKLLTVIGHTNCGAVKGAIDNVEMGHLTGLLDKIKPAMEEVSDTLQPRTSDNKEFVTAVTKAHVQNVIAEIRSESEIISDLEEAGDIKIVGGIYDLSTGEVAFFE